MPSFIRLYLDEDVSVLVGQMISARGFNVLTTRDAGNLGASDRNQLEFSINEKRVLLTHNRRDFELLVSQFFERRIKHSGVIIAVRRLPADLILRTLTVLNSADAEAMVDQIRYI